MPNLQSSKKDLRQSQAKYLVNRQAKDRIARWLKKTSSLIEDGKKEEAVKSSEMLTKLLDKAAKNKIFSPNKVARQKSRVQKKINAL